jgi:hypothetical protein
MLRILPAAASALGRTDHVIARKHGGGTAEDNLALACFYCNSAKGPNIAGIDPQSGQLVPLFNARRQSWPRHSRWVGPCLVGRTRIGPRHHWRVGHQRPGLRVAPRSPDRRRPICTDIVISRKLLRREGRGRPSDPYRFRLEDADDAFRDRGELPPLRPLLPGWWRGMAAVLRTDACLRLSYQPLDESQCAAEVKWFKLTWAVRAGFHAAAARGIAARCRW